MSKEKKPKKTKEEKKAAIKKLIDDVIALYNTQIVKAALMLYLGIRLIINPASAPNKMAWSMGLAIVIAAGTILLEMITTKSFNRKNLVSIIEGFLFLIFGAVMILFSKPMGAVLEQAVCIALIINSITNIIRLIYSRISKKDLKDKPKKSDKKEQHKVITHVRDYMKDDFAKYNDEFIHAAEIVKQKADATFWGQLLLDVVLIVIAVIILFNRYEASIPLYLISGIILCIAGIDNAVFFIRDVIQKKREKKEQESM